MRKTFSAIIAVVLAFSMLLSFAACGDSKTEVAEKYSKGLEFENTGKGTCAVVGIGDCEDLEVIIPAKSPDGDKVTEIGDNAFEKAEITSVTMPNTVTRVGTEAFAYCRALEEIKFSTELKSIGSKAFYNCEKLTEVELPDSLEEFERSVGSDGKEYEGSGTFWGCTELETINIPEDLEAIYENTFKDTNLKNVTIDGKFKYGNFNPVFMSKEVVINLPALYRNDPKLENSKVCKLNDTQLSVLLANIFTNEKVKINGKKIAEFEAVATPGLYGNETEKYAYRITEDSTIESLYFNTTTQEYEVTTYYKTKAEEIFAFELDEDVNAFTYLDSYGDTVFFVIYGDYLYLKGYSNPFVLDQEYKG